MVASKGGEPGWEREEAEEGCAEEEEVLKALLLPLLSCCMASQTREPLEGSWWRDRLAEGGQRSRRILRGGRRCALLVMDCLYNDSL